MTIASEIARLQGVKSDILGAIAEKKVDVPAGAMLADAMLADAPDLIRSIKSGINVKIGQGVYPAVKIGNQLWLAKNLDEELGTLGVDEWYYNGRSEKTRLNSKTDYTSSFTKYSDITISLYDGVLSFLNDRMNVDVFVKVDITINNSIDTDIPVTIYGAHTGAQYVNVCNGVIPAGSTSAIIQGTNKINILADRVISRFFVRVGATSFSLDKAIGVSFSFSCNIGKTDCGDNAVTYEQALANEESAIANNYGRLYTWDNVNDNLSKLGLTKWRWPTNADFEGLVAIDSTGKKFRAKTWNSGTDEFGFSILPTGQVFNGVFSDEGNESVLSASDERTGTSIWSLRTNKNSTRIDFWSTKVRGHSIRLVMDLNEDGTIPDSNIVLEDVPATTAEPLALASEPIVDEEEE